MHLARLLDIAFGQSYSPETHPFSYATPAPTHDVHSPKAGPLALDARKPENWQLTPWWNSPVDRWCTWLSNKIPHAKLQKHHAWSHAWPTYQRAVSAMQHMV